jgi:hypothetical protein
MLCLIPIVGGLLIMMGQHDRSEALFYYFRVEDQVPENHLLRLIDKHISFEVVREQLKDRYSETGRPSIDPELLLRILFLGYLYGIASERKLVEELRMHLAWCWFTGLGFRMGFLLAGIRPPSWMEFQCRVIVQRCCTSCCSPLENIPLQAERHSARRQKLFAFPLESAFTFRPECCSESQRNRVRPAERNPVHLRPRIPHCRDDHADAASLFPSEPCR